MLTEGSIVKFVGNTIARRRAIDLGVNDWGPDQIESNEMGICEEVIDRSLQGHERYICRFPAYRLGFISEFSIDQRLEVRHYTGTFYFFELDEV